jgi:hypothetical protein
LHFFFSVSFIFLYAIRWALLLLACCPLGQAMDADGSGVLTRSDLLAALARPDARPACSEPLSSGPTTPAASARLAAARGALSAAVAATSTDAKVTEPSTDAFSGVWVVGCTVFFRSREIALRSLARVATLGRFQN